MIIHNKNELEDEYDLKGVSVFKSRSSGKDLTELLEKQYTEQQDSFEQSKKSAKRKSRRT